MTVPAPDVGWTLVMAGLALLGLLLFLLAVRFGRWGVWLAGYLCVILAVVIAMFAGRRLDASVTGRVAPTEATQPSAPSGVLHAADRTGNAPAGAPATDEVI